MPVLCRLLVRDGARKRRVVQAVPGADRRRRRDRHRGGRRRRDARVVPDGARRRKKVAVDMRLFDKIEPTVGLLNK